MTTIKGKLNLHIKFKLDLNKFVIRTFSIDFSRVSTNPITSYRIWTRLVIIGSVFLIAWFTSNNNKDKTFATRKESLIIRSQDLDCDSNYLKEVTEFTGCVPKKCGRFVTDNLVTKDDVSLLLGLAKHGLQFGGGSGGASILDLHSGALSKGDSFVNIYKMPEAKGFLNEKALVAYKVFWGFCIYLNLNIVCFSTE